MSITPTTRSLRARAHAPEETGFAPGQADGLAQQSREQALERFRTDVLDLRQDRPVALVVDNTSYYASRAETGFETDFKALRDLFVRPSILHSAMFFYSVLRHKLEEEQYTPILKLTDYLATNGWDAIRSVSSDLGDGEMAVGIDMALHLPTLAPHCKELFFLTSNPQHERIITAVRDLGCRVHVIAPTSSTNRHKTLNEASNRLIPLQQFGPLIAKADRMEVPIKMR